MSDRPASHRHRGAHRAAAWWQLPHRRGHLAELARTVGPPLACALCALAIVLVLAPAVGW